jgi:hypothetical protein
MQSCTNNNVINKENADLMWTRPSRGGNGRLFIDFRDLMSSSCQRGDPCPILFKFELLINLSAFNSSRFLLSTVTTQTLCNLCDGHLQPNGLGIQDATCWACHSKITQDTI